MRCQDLSQGFVLSKGPFTRSDFKDPILGSKNWKQTFRRSDFKVPFCGENVGRSFIVCLHDSIFRTNTESSIWRQNDHRDIMQNLLAPFIFQEECRMNIEHILFPSVFQTYGSRIRVLEGHFQCVHTIRFSEPTKIGSLKNGSCEWALTRFLELPSCGVDFFDF